MIRLNLSSTEMFDFTVIQETLMAYYSSRLSASRLSPHFALSLWVRARKFSRLTEPRLSDGVELGRGHTRAQKSFLALHQI